MQSCVRSSLRWGSCTSVVVHIAGGAHARRQRPVLDVCATSIENGSIGRMSWGWGWPLPDIGGMPARQCSPDGAYRQLGGTATIGPPPFLRGHLMAGPRLPSRRCFSWASSHRAVHLSPGPLLAEADDGELPFSRGFTLLCLCIPLLSNPRRVAHTGK